MREHTLKCHQGIFSRDKLQDYKFFLLHSHTKVLKRQLEEAIWLDWAQGRGILRLGRRVFRVNRIVLNSKFEHWRPKQVFFYSRKVAWR